ncbi:hypothetical protein M8818_004959 [Zalaria obscura]|uniref:Uncharacterized protein n=1 Tax=Zalaria obscura TaxID=2024903 RepID=A0ACC3SAH6_9PEZI
MNGDEWTVGGDPGKLQLRVPGAKHRRGASNHASLPGASTARAPVYLLEPPQPRAFLYSQLTHVHLLSLP